MGGWPTALCLVIHSQLHRDSRWCDQIEGGHAVIGFGDREGAVVEGASNLVNSDRILETTVSRSDTCSFRLRLRSIDLRLLIFNAIPQLNAPRQECDFGEYLGIEREVDMSYDLTHA